MEAKKYLSRPRTIEAVYFEKKGTYDVFNTKIEVSDDTYAYLDGGHVMTVRGDKFRASWEQIDG
jgi:hypothetical protein